MLNNNLKYCRENLEMTQKELGFVFGVHESTVSGWETGKDIIPLNKLIRFCNLYNYSIDFVMGLSRINKGFKKIDKIDTFTIGKSLKSIRKSLGLTQKELAKECAISQTTYSNYELGLYLINTLTLYTICKKFKISPNCIIN